MTEEHPFAQYIRTLGKGRQGSRALSRQEASDAMGMILSGKVEPVQLGAFLMLLRVKEETPEELAGFVSAARNSIGVPEAAVDIDWSSYAGKRRQLPWYVLSALLLASRGISVLMHGVSGSDERVYAAAALASLGIKPVSSAEAAVSRVKEKGFAFVEFASLSPQLQKIMDLRSLFGLRSPVQTIGRMLNPAKAALSVQGIFHPGYLDSHQGAAQLLGENLIVFKGEGGEAERNPDLVCKVKSVIDGHPGEEEWPALFAARHVKDEEMDASRIGKLWRGEIDDEYGRMSVIGTAAVVLKYHLRLSSLEEAERMAAQWWSGRDISFAARVA